MKAKKVLGLALSAMMAISAVVPWTGLTASAEGDTPQASAPAVVESKKPGGGHSDKDEWYKIVHKSDDGAYTGYLDSKHFESKEDAEDWAEGLMGDTHKHGLLWWKEDYTFTSYRVEGDTIVLICSSDKEEPAPDPETHTVTFKVQDGVEGVTLPSDSATVNDGEMVTPPTPAYNEEEWTFEGWFYQDGTAFDPSAPITSDMTLVAKFTEKETEPPVEQGKINKVVITVGENLLADLSTDITKGWINIFAYAADDDDNFVLTSNGMAGGAVFSTSSTSKIPEDLTVENFKNYFGTYNITTSLGSIVSIKECGPEYVQDIYVAKEGEQIVLYIKLEIEGEKPVDPEPVDLWDYEVEYYLDGVYQYKVAYSNQTEDREITLDVNPNEFEGAKLLYVLNDSAQTVGDPSDNSFKLLKNDTVFEIYYVTQETPAQDMTLNMTYADIDSDKVLGHGAAVISSDIDLTAWINEHYTGDVITYDGVQYVYTGVYASTANDATINATLYYREVEVAEENREIQLTFVDADDQTKVLGRGAGVVPSGETAEAWIYNVYNGDVITYGGEKYVYTGANTIVENEDGITATLLYRKAEVVEENREIQLTFVDIDTNKTLGHGAGVVPAGEASEAWIYNVYNGDVITYGGVKYAYTGANTIVENETSITATLYYKKAEVVGKDKEIQLTFVDADDQNKVLGHGAGVVLAGQTVEEWLNEVYPIGDVIEYAGAKYAYTGSNAIVEGEDSITVTLLYRKAEVLEKDKEIQLIFVDADNQTKVLGRGAGVVPAGQSIEEWINEVYPIGDVITYDGEKYAYTGAKSVVEGEDSITATLLYRKDTDPTDPEEPTDPDRPGSGGGYYPSRPGGDEEIDDETTPEAPNPGDGSGSAGPGGAGDGAVPVETPDADPGEELGDDNVPLVEAPQTGRKIAGSIALLAGAAAVAVVTLKKRKDK